MTKTYEILNSQFIFAFKQNKNIRKRQFDFEEELKPFFNVPFSNIAIPDDQDGNIPRFEGVSKHGFSRVQATQFSINLITNYKEEYKRDILKVRDYLSKRIEKINNLSSSENMQFVAFVLELGFEFQTDEEINSFLKEMTGAYVVDKSTKDFSILYSREYKEKYYLNIKCSKYKEGAFRFENGILTSEGNTTQGVSVILDINSKLSHINALDFNPKVTQEIEQETFNILANHKLEDYLNGNI